MDYTQAGACLYRSYNLFQLPLQFKLLYIILNLYGLFHSVPSQDNLYGFCYPVDIRKKGRAP